MKNEKEDYMQMPCAEGEALSKTTWRRSKEPRQQGELRWQIEDPGQFIPPLSAEPLDP